MSDATPSQTVGPFFGPALAWLTSSPPTASPGPGPERGARLLHGTVHDGAGAPVPDAMVELWRAAVTEPPNVFRGAFDRCLTDAAGRFCVALATPPAVDDHQAPHVDVSVFARGLLQRLVTRIYFPAEADANAADPVLAGIEPSRRPTLVAVEEPDGLHFDIRLQGERETVFFAW